MLHLVDLQHKLIIVLLALPLTQVHRLIQQLCYERLSGAGIAPNVNTLDVFQVLVDLDYFVSGLRIRVKLTLAHRCVHLCIVIVELSCALFLELLGILAEFCHFGVFGLEVLDARLLLNEVILPPLKHVYNG